MTSRLMLNLRNPALVSNAKQTIHPRMTEDLDFYVSTPFVDAENTQTGSTAISRNNGRLAYDYIEERSPGRPTTSKSSLHGKYHR